LFTLPEHLHNTIAKGKGQKDKQRSTNHTHKTKDQVTQSPLKTGKNSGAPEWLPLWYLQTLLKTEGNVKTINIASLI
jgi:hypothetical protein